MSRRDRDPLSVISALHLRRNCTSINEYSMYLRLLNALIIVCLAQVALCGPCSSIVADGLIYNLDYLAGISPLAFPSDEYVYQVSLCSALSAPCPNSIDSTTQACNSANVAGVCQTWQDGQRSACCGQFEGVLAENFSNSTDTGISLRYKDGDLCASCDPQARDTVVTIVCDPAVVGAPTCVEIEGASPPVPTYHIRMRHNSGCSVGKQPPGSSPPPLNPVAVAPPQDHNIATGPSAPSGWTTEAVLLAAVLALLVLIVVIGCPMLCCIYIKVRRVEDSEARPFFHWPARNPTERYT